MIDAIGFIVALMVSFILVPIVRKQAIAAGYYDAPGARKIHKYPIPRLGGVAIWLAFMLSLGVIVFLGWRPELHNALPGILAGGTIVFLLGLLDDLFNLSPYLKLSIQFIAALTAFFLGIQINNLDLPGAQLLVLNALSLPVTVIWLVGLMNAMNFIDGIDGLAAGVTTLSALTLTIVALFTNQPSSALLAALLAGSSLGFLVYNFHPARIFMGDSGALFCGFLLACIAVTGVLKTKVAVMLLPIFVLSVPILDITYSVFRRLLRGKNPFLPDADHIHHQFLKAGMGQIRTVTYLYSLCVVGGLISVWYVNYLPIYIASLAVMFLLAFLLIMLVRKIFPLPSPQNQDPADPSA
ncbi:glycosyltransferase family 4 protein [Vampirovibrio chlorellavorus]|uniref:glycosyltransferase family 4 protein n=1 Tax=Vampirovibrio chlorellavorus TaxID=758823 RepID=UPI0026EE4C3D|nr:MraY family glycosyltransferase [Vampirovibrio chlorellavorus]